MDKWERDERLVDNWSIKFSPYVDLREVGYVDGFADMPRRDEKLAYYLIGLRISREEIFYGIVEYLNGYECGKFFSENADVIYDENDLLRSVDFYPSDEINEFEANEVLRKLGK